MADSSTYCICKCPVCGDSFHEWIELYTPFVSFADCWCPSCERFVGARVIPADLHYRY